MGKHTPTYTEVNTRELVADVVRLRAEMGDLGTELTGANAEIDFVTACCRWAEAEVKRLTGSRDGWRLSFSEVDARNLRLMADVKRLADRAVPDGVVVIDGRRWQVEPSRPGPPARPDHHLTYRLIPATEGTD